MVILPPDLDAAIRAIQGESDVSNVLRALNDARMAQVVALAPDAHRVIRSIAALVGRLPALVDESDIADPAFHDAMARMIGTPEGQTAIASLATVAPAGWGAIHADALVAAARKNQCDLSFAAALIGPCNDSASLLSCSNDIAFAIRRWGQVTPETPTAWFDSLSASERDRLLSTLRSNARAVARCLPWLPPEINNRATIDDALNAFAEASPTARAQRADILHLLVARADLWDIEPLTRLACAMGSKEVWDRVHALVQEHPSFADRIVAAAPWNDLSEAVRDAILACADTSDVCATIAAARGRTVVTSITYKEAFTFFAALDHDAWERLEPNGQRQCLHALWEGHAYLAVRSLGLRPDILARAQMGNNLRQAEIGNNLVLAAKRHARDAAALCWALLPVALRDLSPASAHTLIAALPTPPPDPSAFFGSASSRGALDDRASGCTAQLTPDDLARAVAFQRSVDRNESIRSRCEGLRAALRGRRWDDLAPILALLDADARAALLPDSDALIARLAHPDRKEALRQTLDRLASLPPEVGILVRFALNRWQTERNDASVARDAAKAIAHALQSYGDMFLAIVDTIADNGLRDALLPLPKWKPLAHALRNVVHDDPPTAQRLAYALHDCSWSDMLCVLLASPPHHAATIWRTLHPSTRSAIDKTLKTSGISAAYGDMIAAVMQRDPLGALALAAMQSDDDNLRNASIDALAARPDVLCAFVLVVMQSGDDDLRNAGVGALASRTDVLRVMWDNLPQATQQSLRAHPDIAVVVADIPPRSPLPTARRGRIR